jgi:hypothetical protein
MLLKLQFLHDFKLSGELKWFCFQQYTCSDNLLKSPLGEHTESRKVLSVCLESRGVMLLKTEPFKLSGELMESLESFPKAISSPVCLPLYIESGKRRALDGLGWRGSLIAKKGAGKHPKLEPKTGPNFSPSRFRIRTKFYAFPSAPRSAASRSPRLPGAEVPSGVQRLKALCGASATGRRFGSWSRCRGRSSTHLSAGSWASQGRGDRFPWGGAVRSLLGPFMRDHGAFPEPTDTAFSAAVPSGDRGAWIASENTAYQNLSGPRNHGNFYARKTDGRRGNGQKPAFQAVSKPIIFETQKRLSKLGLFTAPNRRERRTRF